MVDYKESLLLYTKLLGYNSLNWRALLKHIAKNNNNIKLKRKKLKPRNTGNVIEFITKTDTFINITNHQTASSTFFLNGNEIDKNKVWEFIYRVLKELETEPTKN